MKLRTQRHRVDHDRRPIPELQPDDLEEVARSVWSDDKHARWIGRGFQVDDHERVLDRMDDDIVGDSVAPRGPVYLHTALS